MDLLHALREIADRHALRGDRTDRIGHGPKRKAPVRILKVDDERIHLGRFKEIKEVIELLARRNTRGEVERPDRLNGNRRLWESRRWSVLHDANTTHGEEYSNDERCKHAPLSYHHFLPLPS